MSQGKYSPWCPRASYSDFKYNCYKQIPTTWTVENKEVGVVYDEKTMADRYDSEGFDSYGYSAFDAEGQYVGIGSGIDRYGYTEHEYMEMDTNEFLSMVRV